MVRGEEEERRLASCGQVYGHSTLIFYLVSLFADSDGQAGVGMEFYCGGIVVKNSNGRGSDKVDHYDCIGSHAYEKLYVIMKYYNFDE